MSKFSKMLIEVDESQIIKRSTITNLIASMINASYSAILCFQGASTVRDTAIASLSQPPHQGCSPGSMPQLLHQPSHHGYQS